MGKVEKRDGSNSIDRISELPKEILQRILYFLSQKQAVQTSILSKSWRYIWCTRPNLDFSDENYLNRNKQEFLTIVDKNLQRYYDQRLCVEEFHLRISFGHYVDHGSVSLLQKWIPLLTNMGMKKFFLSLPSEIQFEFLPRHLTLPPVVFGAESLQDLHLERFMLDQKAIERIVLFKHLKRLRLERVCIEDEIFQKIISNCPSIGTLHVKRCLRLRTIKVNDLHNLKHFSFFGMCHSTEELCSIEIYPPTLETIKIKDTGNLRFHNGEDFSNLNQLYLHNTKLLGDNLRSCKFPSLKILRISSCDGLEETQIFIDAPNIRSYEYRGSFVPSISFATTSREWKSDIQLTYQRHPNDDPSLWFLRLKELLNSISQSRISLSIHQSFINGANLIQENINLVQDIIGGDKRAVSVETLTLRCHQNLGIVSSLLNCVFCICRPRYMNGCLSGRNTNEWTDTECLWKILMQEEIGDQLHQFSLLLCVRDLEEVSFEIRDRNRDGWHTITLSDLPNYQNTGCRYHGRFAFKWRGLHLARDHSKKPIIETDWS